jgi:thiol-disulfide isomerase/thioredoxin
MARTPGPDRHPDDLGPPELGDVTGPTRPGLPRGVLWAGALAIVVLAVMAWVALTGPDSGTATGVDRLNNSVAQPGGGSQAGPGGALPALTLVDLDGGEINLADYVGTPLVVNFWASWCPPCLKEMPDFEAVYQARSGEVAFVGINVRESAAVASDLAGRTGVTYDLALDPDGAASRAFTVVNMPTTVFVNADGEIVSIHAGALDAAQLNTRINGITRPA